MCIAIANLKNKPLTDEQLSNCWENNNDGAGILYKEKGILKVYKNLTSLPKFIKKYKKVIQNSNCLIHFRITTGGGVTTKNCHPFLVNHELGFIHNGVISKYSGMVKDQSDTYSFTEMVLKNLPSNFLDYPVIHDMIDSVIGSSKLAFMDNEEKFTIIGEKAYGAHYGEEGNWYSNNSYKQVNSYSWAGNTKVYKKSSAATTKINYATQKWDYKLGKYRDLTADELAEKQKAYKNSVSKSSLKLVETTSKKDKVIEAYTDEQYENEYQDYLDGLVWDPIKKEYVDSPKDAPDTFDKSSVYDFVSRLCDLFDQVPTAYVKLPNKLFTYIVSFKQPIKLTTHAVNMTQALYMLKMCYDNVSINGLTPKECKEIYETTS